MAPAVMDSVPDAEQVSDFLQYVTRLARTPLSPALIPLLYTIAPAVVIYFSVSAMYADLLSAAVKSELSDTVEVFDFIVVGAGSAGAAVANRLSLNSKVLLLEAGGTPHPLAAIPVAQPILLNQAYIDWRYRTASQANSSFGLENNSVRWPRGKSLGGSSVLNNMIYMRGNPKDFDEWAELSNDSSWRYENVLPFFKKLETYKGHFPDEKYHGVDGPVHVEQMRFARGVKEWLAAGRELGYSVKDLNGWQEEGFSYLDVTMKRGSRFDTNRAYLQPIRERKNLKIYKHAHVYKVHLDRRRNAYGVSYYRHGVNRFVRADREIIISGGTINSAHLLLLSGIGPKKHLNSKNVKCRLNLPVGRNLHDHAVVNVGPFIINETLSLLSDRDVSVQSVVEFLMLGKGPLVSSAGISATALISSSLAKPGWPDILLLQIGAGLHQAIGSNQEKALGFRDGILQKYYKPFLGKDANFVTVMLGKPKSRGSVELRNNDPFNYPTLEPRYLSHPDDLRTLLEGVQFVLTLFEKTKTYRKIGAHLGRHHFPGCEQHKFASPSYWECYVRFNLFSLHHQAGTCRMGAGRNDPLAVVDSKLRVLRARRLRVIDASIMPAETNANLNIPVIMIGEKGAFEIRSYWADQFLVCHLREYLLFGSGQQETKCYYARRI